MATHLRILEVKRIVTFLDNFLKVEEERDFLIRVNEGKLKIEEFHENESKFGTISIITGVDLPPQRIFELLKSRVEIEITFDTFKNVLNVKIGDNWVISEIPKKTRLLIEKLEIDLSIT